MKKGQPANKKANIHTKVGKYFMAVQKGKKKTEAKAIAGYKPQHSSTAIERTKEFQALQTKFGTSLLQKISIDEINDYLIDNIKQENSEKIDRNARNGAIKLAKDMIEPEGGKRNDEGDKVLIVLSK